MLRATTIQERLWELRKDKGLNLEELAQQTGISKSALASYEANDNKEIIFRLLVFLDDGLPLFFQSLIQGAKGGGCMTVYVYLRVGHKLLKFIVGSNLTQEPVVDTATL